MSNNIDEIRVKKETSKIHLGLGIAIFGCFMILLGACLPPVGIIDGSILTAVGELFSLSGALLGVFSLNRRDNAKLDSIYNYIESKKTEDETDTEEDVQ